MIDVESGETIRELKGHSNHARCVAFTPDGTRVITGSYDHTVKIWDAATGELLDEITHNFGRIFEVSVSSDGKLLAIADPDKFRLCLFDMKTLRSTFSTERMEYFVPHVSFSPDGSLVSASSWGGYSRLYNVATKQLKYELDTAGGTDWTCFSPDGNQIAVAAQLNIYVYAFPAADDETAQRVRSLISQFEVDDYPIREQASRELAALGGVCEPFLAAAMESDDPEVRWRTRRLRQYLSSTDAATKLVVGRKTECVVFSPDGKLLVAGDKQGNLIAWNVDNWTIARRFAIEEY